MARFQTMAGGNDYQDIAASQSNVVLARASASAGGGVGDYLSHVLVIPETVAAGTISVQDGSATAVNIFIAGTLPSLVPFAIPVQSYSVNGAWKVTTGANVHVRAVGNFS